MKGLYIFFAIVLLLTIYAVIFTDCRLMVWAEEPAEATEEITEIIDTSEIEVLQEINNNLFIIICILVMMVFIHYAEKWFKVGIEQIKDGGK